MNSEICELVSKEVGDEFYELVEGYFTNYPRRFNQVLSIFKDILNNQLSQYPERYNDKDVEYINNLNNLVEGKLSIEVPTYKYLLDEAIKLDNVNQYGVNRILNELIDTLDYFMMGIANPTFKSNDYIIFRDNILGRISKLTSIPLDKLTLDFYIRSICKSLKIEGE